MDSSLLLTNKTSQCNLSNLCSLCRVNHRSAKVILCNQQRFKFLSFRSTSQSFNSNPKICISRIHLKVSKFLNGLHKCIPSNSKLSKIRSLSQLWMDRSMSSSLINHFSHKFRVRQPNSNSSLNNNN